MRIKILYSKFHILNFNNKGQAMLLAVVLVSSVVLTVTAIAGYFTLQRIRMSSNFTDSTKAIFAADAGLECEFYKFFKGVEGVDCNNLSFLDEKTKVRTIVEANSIKSIGTSNKSFRAFFSEF